MTSESEPTIRTMKTDTEELMQKEKSTFLEMFSRREDTRYDKGYQPTPPRARRSYGRAIAILVALLVLAGIGAGVYWYIKQKPKEAPPITVSIPRSVINPQKTEKIKTKTGDRTGILLALKAIAKSSDSDLWYIPVTVADLGVPERLATPKDFFDTLRITPPAAFYDTLTGKWNLYLQSGSFIFLFEIKDRANALGAILGWEESMPSDLGPIVDRTNIGLRIYQDIIIKNVDARLTKPSNTDSTMWGHSIVLGKYLVIATSEETLKTTIERIVAGPLNE
jgi:hypothetical protein